MRKLVASIMVACMLMGLIPAVLTATPTITAAAAEKKVYLLDCSKTSDIEAKNLVVEKKIVKDNKQSAKWTIGSLVDLRLTNVPDITPYTTLNFWAYGDSKKPVTMLIRFYSNDPSKDGEDYYSFKGVVIQEDGWHQYSFDMSALKTDRTPLGKDQIKDIIMFTNGWGMVTDPTAVIYLDSVYLSDAAPAATPAPSVAPTSTPTPALDVMGDGVALLLGSSSAYAKKALTKVDPDNESVTPMVVNDRTLVPVRFISESFGAQVGWDGPTQTVTVTLAGKSIKLVLGSTDMIVDGATKVLDVPAQSINDRTMIPLRAMSEALGKELLWDDRGLILITSKKLDAVKDSRVVDTMLGYLRTSKLTTAYNPAPRLTTEVLNFAFAQRPVYFGFSSNKGSGTQENAGSVALYYLSYAALLDPQTKSASGVLAKDKALEHIRSLISGGKEPLCANGPYWAHASITSALVMAKKSPAVWSELTAEEIAKVDLVMKSLAISVNWGFNDKNTYKTGLDMIGNFEKGWNPNYRASFLPGIINCVLYFGDADTVNKIFTSFNYDSYMKELENAGFQNIIKAWSAAGKDLMEKGGAAKLVDGNDGGTGAGVKMEFAYKEMKLNNIEGIFSDLVKYAYGANVADYYGTKGSPNHAYILNNGTSPFLGQPGMMLEFASVDANGIRSDAHYCYSTTAIMMPFITNLRLFNGWDGSTDIQKACDKLIYVGTEDFIYKAVQGYHSYSKGVANEHHEWSFIDSGYMIAKELWRKVINFSGEPTTVLKNPNAVEKPVLPEAATAEPKDGVTAPPAGAIQSYELAGNFAKESIYALGKEYTGKVTTEFDLTFGPGITPGYNGVLAYTSKSVTEVKYSNLSALIQFTNGTINVRNGSDYVSSAVQFNGNYKFHFRTEFDLSAKKYSVWVTPTYPTAGAEVQIAKDFAFRTGSAEIKDISVIAMTCESPEGPFWVENHKTNGDLLKK